MTLLAVLLYDEGSSRSSWASMADGLCFAMLILVHVFLALFHALSVNCERNALDLVK